MTAVATRPAIALYTRRIALALGAGLVLALIVWQAIATAGAPDPLSPRTSGSAAILDIAVLVFREGLECILVLSAITAGMRERQGSYREPIAWGALAGAVATILTWFIAVRAIDALSDNVSALHLQAVTGLIAIVVLLLVMNWFFHRLYWTGWIGMHNRRKRALLDKPVSDGRSRGKIVLGLAALGFTSLYREGFEIVLFLQSYRLKLGDGVVFGGLLIGAGLTLIVGLLTFVARRRLPYKQMLIATGALLAAVLFVMVGEQAQEMQLAHWLPTTTIAPLVGRIPSWTGLWFAIFPTVETLAAQALALTLVVGSYFVARARSARAV